MVRRRVYYAGLADARRENVFTASDIAKSGESKSWLVLWGTREGDYHITETHARDADEARSYALKHFPEIAGVGDVMPGQKARFLGKKGRRIAGVLE